MPQTPEHPIEKHDQEETLEFLKRNEVRTMAKDVAGLREEESKEERKKISDIKTEAPVPLPTPLMPASSAGRPSSVPKETPPRRPPHFDKVFIRVALILGVTFVLVNITAFAVWNMKKNSAPVNEPAPAPELGNQVSSEGNLVSPEPEPASLFPIERTEIIEVQQPDQIVASLTQFFQQNSEPGFIRILFKDAGENRFLTLAEVLHGANFILAPELGESDTFFVFVLGDFKRIGFAASIKDPQTASDALRAQEKTFEQDAAPILSVVGRKGQGYTALFRTAFHKGIPIRFQTLSVRDFGIVYAIVKDTLVFTTSLESMKRGIDLLAPNQ